MTTTQIIFLSEIDLACLFHLYFFEDINFTYYSEYLNDLHIYLIEKFLIDKKINFNYDDKKCTMKIFNDQKDELAIYINEYILDRYKENKILFSLDFDKQVMEMLNVFENYYKDFDSFLITPFNGILKENHKITIPVSILLHLQFLNIIRLKIFPGKEGLTFEVKIISSSIFGIKTIFYLEGEKLLHYQYGEINGSHGNLKEKNSYYNLLKTLLKKHPEGKQDASIVKIFGKNINQNTLSKALSNKNSGLWRKVKTKQEIKINEYRGQKIFKVSDGMISFNNLL